MINEHIVMVDELFDHSTEPAAVCQRETITNRVKGVVTEFVFYDEGFLRVREARKGRRTREHLLELCFLDPRPVSSRRAATTSLWTALSLGLTALLAAFVIPMTSLAQYTFSVTAVVATLALLALLLFVYRRAVRHQFFTASGQAVVLTLAGSFGCIRRSRAIAGAIEKAIRTARNQTAERDIDYLRAEMKAHYKLAETGVITHKECADGTTLILSKFN